jgi:hypothetical protein
MLQAELHQLIQAPIMFERFEGMNRLAWGNKPAQRLWMGAEQRAMQDNQLPEVLAMSGGQLFS